MKKIFIVLLILTQLSIIGYAQESDMLLLNTINKSTKQEAVQCSSLQLNILEFGRGCCSHHGGVCGCSNGRALCCDGTLSPSCGCMNETPIINNNL